MITKRVFAWNGIVCFLIILLSLIFGSCEDKEKYSISKDTYGKELKHQFINYATITKDSVARYDQLAAKGDAEAMFLLAHCYARGVWCEQDSLKAITLLRKAAVAGDYDAQMRMCEVYHFKDYYFYEHRDYSTNESPIDAPYDLWGAGYAQLDFMNDNNVKQTQHLADQGEAWAQVLIGKFYSSYSDVPYKYDWKKALEWYKKAEEQGFAWGQAYYGNFYDLNSKYRNAATQGCRWALAKLIEDNSEKVDTLFKYCYPVFDTDTAKQWNVKADSIKVYQQGAQHGVSQCEWQLGICYYYDDKGVERDTEKGWELLRYSAHKGNPRGCNAFANVTNDECKRAKFFYWYEAARQGNAYALTSCGHSLVKHNFNLAYYFYDKAYQRDSTDLWILCTSGKELYDSHHANYAYYYLKKTVELGSKDNGVKYRLGQCYYHGWGVGKDYSKALKYFHEVEQNIPIAKTYIGICHENAQGVKQDMQAALEWYRKGEAASSALACYRLGLCYEYGRGVPRDMGKAVEYYRNAADLDKELTQAAMRLAECYNTGNGVAKDTVEALSWYRKASEQGNEYATAQLPKRDEEKAEQELIEERSSDNAFFEGLGEICGTPRNWDSAKANFSVWFKKANFFVLLIFFGLFCWLLWAIVRGFYRLFKPKNRFAGKEYRVVFEDENNETWLFSDRHCLLITDKEGVTKEYAYTLEKNSKLRINNYRGHDISLLTLKNIDDEVKVNGENLEDLQRINIGNYEPIGYFFQITDNNKGVTNSEIDIEEKRNIYIEDVLKRLGRYNWFVRNKTITAIVLWCVGVISLVSPVIYFEIDNFFIGAGAGYIGSLLGRKLYDFAFGNIEKRIRAGYRPKSNEQQSDTDQSQPSTEEQ